MTKQKYIYLVILIFVGITAWFFISKIRHVTDEADLVSLTIEESASPTPTTVADDEKIEKWITLDSGLKLLDTQIGYGREARPGDMISAHYSGTLENGNKFDSSYDRGQPFSFVLGGGMVIKGWDIGIAGMKVGGKRKLIIPPSLGYGDRELGGGIIPSNSTLIFEVELVAVEDANK